MNNPWTLPLLVVVIAGPATAFLLACGFMGLFKLYSLLRRGRENNR